MRLENSIKNLTSAWFGQILITGLKFLARTVFVATLSSEYLGLNGLFASIIMMLSLTELGIGTAINYSLYEPLATKNDTKIKALMQIYRKTYQITGLLILGLGALLLPWLDFFIDQIPQIENIKLIYLLYILNASIPYFFSYKSGLIIADQKQYITNIYHYSSVIILNVIQIIILLITHNFLLYLTAQVVIVFIENYLIAKRADKLYPYINAQEKICLDGETKESIVKNTSALAIHKLGGVVINSTDNIVISKFIGIVSVGVYSNYFLITSSINAFLIRIFTSLTASIGNLNVEGNQDKTNKIFEVVFFINFLFYGVSTIGLYVLINPFIKLWLGAEYVLSNSTMIVIVINFYINGIKHAAGTFKNALGLYWQDRYKPIFESLINIVASIALVTKFGIAGVFMGTILSNMLTCFWIEPLVLYKFGFQMSSRTYFVKWIKYFIIVIITSLVTKILLNWLVINSILKFILAGVITVFISTILFSIFLFYTHEYKYFKNLLMHVIQKTIRKISKKWRNNIEE